MGILVSSVRKLKRSEALHMNCPSMRTLEVLTTFSLPVLADCPSVGTGAAVGADFVCRLVVVVDGCGVDVPDPPGVPAGESPFSL
jgi:hypothetical protein